MGAAGFIGTNLALALLKMNSLEKLTEILLVDEKMEYFQDCPIKYEARVKLSICQFGEDTDFINLMKENDIVYHLISTTTPTNSNQHISNEITENIAITVNLLEACVKRKINRIIFISSGGTVYGDAECPIPETAETNPITTYGIQKLTIEKMLFLYNYMYGLEYRIARLSNPYGPYQRPNGRLGVITMFTDCALRGKKVVVYGDGSVVRDYIYIDDAITAILNISFYHCKYRIYNVGSGIGLSIKEVLYEIMNVLNVNIDIEHTQSRNVDLKMNYIDPTRYESEFGEVSRVELSEGVKKTALFLKKELDL